MERRTISVDSNVIDALQPAAAARGITVNTLARRLLASIAHERLADAVLDDLEGSCPQQETSA